MSRPFNAGARIDANQRDVVRALREGGFAVAITSGAGKGFPDLLVSLWADEIGPFSVLLEVKDGKKPPSARKLTPDQKAFIRRWLGALAIVYGPKEALWLCRELQRGNVSALEYEPFYSRLPKGRRGAFGEPPGLTAPGYTLDLYAKGRS